MRQKETILLSGLLMLLCAFPLQSQISDLLKGFKLPYYESTVGGSQTNFLKSQITGSEAVPQTNGLVLVRIARIEDYLPDGRTNLIARAPQCTVDYKSRIAFSPGPLEVETGNGQLIITGKGFLYYQTNFNLVISNQVETTIHRELIRSTNALPSVSPLPETKSAGGTNTLIKIFAEHFFLESASNLATYTGHVRIDDPQTQLTCETLIIHRSTNGTVESIVADQNVFMTNKVDGSRATGERATYSLDPGKEVVVLTGQQAQWQDAERQGKAGSFTFDRRANTVLAQQSPSMRLLRSAIGQPDWLTGRPAALTNTIALTNQFVDITAEEMIIRLPSTNQPARHLAGRTNVVIISQADKSRATSDQAVYDEGTGTVELTGHAVWQSDQRLVKGEKLVFDSTNKVFTARQNAYLKMPLSALGPSTGTRSAQSNLPPVLETVEVFSDHFIYEPAAVTFYEQVRVNYFRDEVLNGWMTSGALRVGFSSNRVENLVANTSVALEQPAIGTNDEWRVDKKLNCESLTVHFYTNGLVQSMLAETNVLAQQHESRRGRPLPIHTQLSAGSLSLSFSATTNQVREIIAEKNVAFMQDAKTAHGQKAVYTASNNVARLTGHPTADTAGGRITEAEVLIWDRTRNTLKGQGRKVVGEGEVPGKAPTGRRPGQP